METAVKQRLIGAAVLAALAMIFLPMVMQGPDVTESDAAQVPLDLPAAPGQKFETRELPLAEPAPAAPAGGVLGMQTPAGTPAEADPNAVVTVDEGASPPPPVMPEPATVAPVDAATGQPLAAEPATPPAAALPAAAPPAAAPTAAESVATPAPAAAAPMPVASAGGRFAVNVGSFSNISNARALAARLGERRLPVITDEVQLGGKPALRLRVGPYGERAAAEAARLRVEEITGGVASVLTLDATAAAPRSATSTTTAAPAPTPAAAKPRPAAAAGTGFAVQLGALRAESDAIALRDRARAAGFVAFHQRMETANGVLYRVRVGPEADRAAADQLRTAVNAKLGVSGIVVAHP